MMRAAFSQDNILHFIEDLLPKMRTQDQKPPFPPARKQSTFSLKQLISGVMFFMTVYVVYHFVLPYVEERFLQEPQQIPTLSSLELETLEGEAVDLRQFQGRPIFLSCWATWCGPCIEEMPSMEDAKKKYPAYVFILVSEESSDKLKEFVAKHPQYTFLFARTPKALPIEFYPTTFLYNTQGEGVFGKVGSTDWMEEQYLQLLQQHGGAGVAQP